MRIPYSVFRAAAAASVLLGFAAQAAAQAPSPSAPSSGSTSNSKVGVAVHVSSLGIGGDVAVRLSERANLRAGMDTFSLTRDFNDNDITYTGKASLRSAHAFLDWFPMGGGFHISPGVVFGNNTKVTLSSSIPAGKKITIDDTDYVGSSTNPMKASGEVTVASAAAALTMGWGNLVPQGHRFSVPFEIGITLGGKPTGVLGFTGSACAVNGTNCRDVATAPDIQAEIRNQQTKLNDKLNKGFAKFYPVLSLGLGIRF